MKITGYFIILILFGCLSLYALEVPPAKSYVNDYTGLLTSAEAQSLDNKLREYDKQTTNQVVVLIIKSLEGQSIESFGIKVAEKWKAGQKGKDNGVIFIIAKDDRKTRIEVGYGLEAVLTDLKCALILDRVVKPRFREGKYFEGIDKAIQSILGIIGGDDSITTQNYPEEKHSTRKGPVILLVVLGIVIFWIVMRTRRSVLHTGGHWHTGGFGDSGSGGGGFSSGGGFGGGGGFSGGGGSFGGGGASGGW